MQIIRKWGLVLAVVLDIILKYWLQVALGLIAAGFGLFHKRIKAWRDAHKAQEAKILKDSIVKEVKEALDDLTQRSDANDQAIKLQMDELRAGLLVLQGDVFKAKCREALKEGHVITLEEFENLQREHNVYKGLGGNHDGDQIFDLILHKYEHSL